MLRDEGVPVVTSSIDAEEQTGFKDKITFEFTGSNLDKKDLFSESDPFFTISRSGLKS